MRDTFPFLMFNSLEGKDDPVKVIAQQFTYFEKMRDIPVIVFNSLERKEDPCKSDCLIFYHFWKIT